MSRKVIVHSDFVLPQVLLLEQALAPKPFTDHGSGQLEDVQAQAELNAKVIGKILTVLVNNKSISLQAAAKIAEVDGTLEVVEE